MALSKDQIFTAADELVAAGQTPTLAKVRAALNGGSFTTISEAMSEWKARQQAAATPLREPAPQAIADRLAELGAEVWTVALELASGRLAVEREALEAARAEMEAVRIEAAELADQVSTELDTERVRSAELEARAVAAEKEIAGLRGQLASIQEQAHTAEARAVEIERRAADLRAELDRAHQDAQRAAERLTAAQTERDEARKEASAAREEAAHLAGQLVAHQEQTSAILAHLAPATGIQNVPGKQTEGAENKS